MKVEIGEKIRELRRRDDRTQEDLAGALGVTCQAVSRWEAGGGYPDMEMLPGIANYFGVSMDTLFGFHANRDARISEIIARVDAYHIKAQSDGEWVEECVGILREGLAEFPQEERLLIALADALSEAGWRRQCEWVYYDEEGYMRHDYDRHRENKYWVESVKICEGLVDTARDNRIVTQAIALLVLLYRNFGETEKAVACAMRMPELKHCRELLLAEAADGREEAGYIREALLEMADHFARQMIYGLVNCVHHFESDRPIEKIKGAVSLFGLACDDGNLGMHHDIVVQLYLYLSRVQWERGYHDDAFVSLDEAYRHRRALEAVVRAGKEPGSEDWKAVEKLPEDWPMWCNPDYSQVEKEIKADPRWAAWVEKTKG